MENVKIVVLGVGESGALIVDRMIAQSKICVDFAIACEDENVLNSHTAPTKIKNIDDYTKFFNDADMVFIVNICGAEQDFAFSIAKSSKLADTLTIVMPVAGEKIKEKDIETFLDVSDAIILSWDAQWKAWNISRRTHLNIEAIVELIQQEQVTFSEVKEIFCNIGRVFVGVGLTESYEGYPNHYDIYDAYYKASTQTPSGGFNYLINVSTDEFSDFTSVGKAIDEMYQFTNTTSDNQIIACGHVIHQENDAICRVTVFVGMDDSGYRNYSEMLDYLGEDSFFENIKEGLTETQIVKYGSYTKVLEMALRQGLPELVRLVISKGANPKNLEKNGVFDEDILNDIMEDRDVDNVLEIINILFDTKINIDKNLINPFVRSKNPDMAKILQAFINYGWNVNAHDERGITVLMIAVMRMSFEAIKVLITAGADVNAQTEDGYTSLTYFGRRRMDDNDEVFEFLVENGAIIENYS